MAYVPAKIRHRVSAVVVIIIGIFMTTSGYLIVRDGGGGRFSEIFLRIGIAFVLFGTFGFLLSFASKPTNSLEKTKTARRERGLKFLLSLLFVLIMGGAVVRFMITSWDYWSPLQRIGIAAPAFFLIGIPVILMIKSSRRKT